MFNSIAFKKHFIASVCRLSLLYKCPKTTQLFALFSLKPISFNNDLRVSLYSFLGLNSIASI
nr:hypothetical protein [Brachyspira aalborgi]